MATQAANDSNFDSEVLESSTPVVVDFWAEWCGPCKALGPIVDDLAGEMDGKVKVVKVNIDESPETPTKYGIRSVPTLMIFKDGNLVDTRIGALNKAELTQWVEGAVS